MSYTSQRPSQAVHTERGADPAGPRSKRLPAPREADLKLTDLPSSFLQRVPNRNPTNQFTNRSPAPPTRTGSNPARRSTRRLTRLAPWAWLRRVPYSLHCARCNPPHGARERSSGSFLIHGACGAVVGSGDAFCFIALSTDPCRIMESGAQISHRLVSGKKTHF
jgi:hypothetical protein